ncbi:MarR family transcriptional regulator [Adlercreutzia sp. ZJ141]|uniref:MarR family transcriptional regulator n=1 Tax=Adlercreutzia sp. ZJ141 TaxID=2709406 RepID=UPI0013EB71C4|nr:MarR family transcriptional regulator [Adlercreutzia sp. ZJ141]
MLYVYEFEVFEDDGLFLAFPYDMDGGTQGANFREVCEMTADWLQAEMEHRAMHDQVFPEPTFGNKPEHGGQNLVVAVNAGKDTVPRMTSAAAARELGITPGRVSQMVKAGLLETFDYEGRTWITRHSVEARKAESPKAGRPKKAILA